MKASISIVRIWIHLGLIPSADVSLYIWALDYLFFNLLTWGTLLFLGFVFNCVPRCLLFLILYLPLRIYAGGFHAKTKIGCYLISAFATVYKGNIIKNLIMDCQSYTKYRPNETTGGIFVSWRRKEELPTGA